MTKQRKASAEGLKVMIPKQLDYLELLTNESSTYTLPQLKQHFSAIQQSLQEVKNRKGTLQHALQTLEKQHEDFVKRKQFAQKQQTVGAKKERKQQSINDYFKVKTDSTVKQESIEEQMSAKSEKSKSVEKSVKQEEEIQDLLLPTPTTVNSDSMDMPSPDIRKKSRKNGRKNKKKVINSDSESEVEFAPSSDDEFVPDVIMSEVSESSEMEDDIIIKEEQQSKKKKIQPLNQTLLNQKTIEEPPTPSTPALSSIKSEEEVTETELDEITTPTTLKRKRRRQSRKDSSSKRLKVSRSSTIDVHTAESLWDDAISREKPKMPIDQFWFHLDKYYFRPVLSTHVAPQVFLPFSEDDSSDPLFTVPPLTKTDSSVTSRALSNSFQLNDEDDFAFLDTENENQMTDDNANLTNGESKFDVLKASRGFSRRHVIGAMASSSQQMYTSTDFAERLLSSLVSQNSFLTVPEIVNASTKGGVLATPDSKRAARFAKPSRNAAAILQSQDDSELGKYEAMLESRVPKQERVKLENAGKELLAKTLPISDFGESDQAAQRLHSTTSDYDISNREALSTNLYNELSNIGIICNSNIYDSSKNDLPIQDDEVSAEIRVLQNHLREHRNRIRQIYAEVREKVLQQEAQEIDSVRRRLKYIEELKYYKENATPQVIPD